MVWYTIIQPVALIVTGHISILSASINALLRMCGIKISLFIKKHGRITVRHNIYNAARNFMLSLKLFSQFIAAVCSISYEWIYLQFLGSFCPGAWNDVKPHQSDQPTPPRRCSNSWLSNDGDRPNGTLTLRSLGVSILYRWQGRYDQSLSTPGLNCKL